jgi:hypothetical protein
VSSHVRRKPRCDPEAKEELAGEGWLIVVHDRGTYVADAVPGDSD